MLTKLPRWVGIGAFFLALAAGSINIVMLESLLHQAVTNHTGNTSTMMIALAQGHFVMALHLFLVVFTYLAGSVLSGFIIRDSHLTLGRRYGYSLVIETAAILGAWRVFGSSPFSGQLLLSGASGLQNALATTYSGAVIRTTHLTGIYTDIGVLLGNRLAGIPMPPRKLKLLVTIVAGFLAGGLIGALLFSVIGVAVLAIPASISGSLATAYFVYRHFFMGPKHHPVWTGSRAGKGKPEEER